MNAEELADRIYDEGGVTGVLRYGLDLRYIEDDQLRQAWQYLTEEWQRFEVHIHAFEAILNGKLGTGRV